MLRLSIDSTEDELGFERQVESSAMCYELRSLELDNRTTLVLSNTRELDRVPKTK